MSGWILACAVFATAAIVGWLWRRRAQREWASLEEALDQLREGRRPDLLGGAASGRCGKLARRLELVAELQERLRQEIQHGEAHLQTVLASMEEGVVVVDAQHVLQQTNPSFRKFFDLKTDPRGQTVLRTLRETEVEELIAAALTTDQPQSGEVSFNGVKPPRHFSVNAVPMRDDEGRPGVVAIFRDVSRLRQLEDVRREFVANVSHELRTPLSIFHGYVENLLDDPAMPAPAQREIFEILRKHSLRLNALLEDLLTLARLESRHDSLRLEPLQLATFVETTCADWKSRIAKKGVELVIAIPNDLPTLNADPMRLEQVVNNLLENATKYTEQGGRIAIGAELVGDGAVEVRVEDSGIGIPPGDLPHIFERFYRADKARTRGQGGTGLGLSIVKHIVQSHGGTVRAESTYGKGTAIIFRLPLAPTV
jgi:two-component system phosphate regulon sensor histidine kinase PhoR